MSARNTGIGYGWVSRLVHWAMAAGILGMIGLGLRIATMQPRLSNLWLYGLHKSIGLVLLALVLLRLVWHRISPPPPLSPKLPVWQHGIARMAHGGLYTLMLAVPLCGWVASAATGIDVVLFGRITLPPVAPASAGIEAVFFGLHKWVSYLLTGLIGTHAAAAIYDQFVLRDGGLRRIWRGS